MMTVESGPILRLALAEPVPKWIPGLRLENLRRCPHWTQQERPSEANHPLREFIADLG